MLVCKQSAVEIRPKQLSHQLRTLYMHQLQSLASLKLVCLVVDQVLPTLHAEPLLEPSREALIRLRGAPIPHSRPRIGCDSCPFLCACVRVMQRHYNANHAPNHDDASDLCAVDLLERYILVADVELALAIVHNLNGRVSNLDFFADRYAIQMLLIAPPG